MLHQKLLNWLHGPAASAYRCWMFLQPELGSNKENNGAWRTAVLENEQRQDYWFVISIVDASSRKPLTHELKVSNRLPSELYTLLLEDILVLLQKQDERLILKCHSKNLAGTADTKHTFSPIIKLNTVLVRSVATGQCRLSACFSLYTCG